MSSLSTSTARSGRRHGETSYRSGREEFQRDCDRILYCSAWARLANITQILSPTQGSFFHNRLTHSLKVAQIGRRIAERLLRKYDEDVIESCGGLSPDVVEAAGRAHDLGHPPFGHIGEETLNRLVTEEGVLGGFEGNAQSFRILTKLSYRQDDNPGLNLTRATLNAVLKYPWFRATEDGMKKSKKWGAYESERDDFDWVRESGGKGDRRTLEAEIMDYADEVAYSIYDLDDFYRAGFIPLELLFSGAKEKLSAEAEFFFRTLALKEELETSRIDELKATFKEMSGSELLALPPYKGTIADRAMQRDRTAYLVYRYIEHPKLDDRNGVFLQITKKIEDELFLLKRITWHYIIESSRLLIQQHGQREMLQSVFKIYNEASKNGRWQIFPPMQRELLELNSRQRDKAVRESRAVRIVVDMVAGLTETQLIEIHQHLSGHSPGMFRAPIV